MESSRDDFVIAIRSAFLKKQTKQRFSLLSLILFSIIFLVAGTFNLKSISFVKKIIKEIVYTSSFVASLPENIAKNTYKNISSHFYYHDDYQKIRDELDILKSKDLNNEIINLENIKYKKLIDDYFIKDNETFAKVLIDKQSPFLRSIVINKGSKNNIELGMIALDQNYLVGKVVEVNYLTSRVLLISDLNSKIPVSLQPGDTQAIMSGKNKTQGVLQYIKDKSLENSSGMLEVTTSGAGGAFISGIPIGRIKKSNDTLDNTNKIVDFHKDFSQLKYVKIVSYSKINLPLDGTSKDSSKKQNDEIIEKNQRNETLRILVEQKEIADEIRIKIEEENIFLKNKNIKLQKEITIANTTNEKNIIANERVEFLEKNLLYGHKCRKTFYNNLYKINTQEYRNCIINKGIKK
jgi:rod shape-determining protein MreC